MFATPDDKQAGKIECRIYENEYDVFVKMFSVLDDTAIIEIYRGKGTSRFSVDFMTKIRAGRPEEGHGGLKNPLPLVGFRVAIDPGHCAGSYDEAVRERKFMHLYMDAGKDLRFYEAQLNYETARILKEMLEKDGALVMISREAGRQAYPVPYHRWVRANFRQTVYAKLNDMHISRQYAMRLLHGADEKEKFRFFNSEIEMPYRAKIINAFRPHITVLIHYDSWDDETAISSKYFRIKEIVGKKNVACAKRLKDIEEVVESVPGTDRNYCSVFVPGCFLRGELNTLESRIEFLRLIISPDLDNSVVYAKYVLDNFKKYLDVPGLHESNRLAKHVSMWRPGLYARNFRMTRLVRGALCLGEPLIQNNIKEAVELAQVARGVVPNRVKLVARSYYEAIREYAQKSLSLDD